MQYVTIIFAFYLVHFFISVMFVLEMLSGHHFHNEFFSLGWCWRTSYKLQWSCCGCQFLWREAHTVSVSCNYHKMLGALEELWVGSFLWNTLVYIFIYFLCSNTMQDMWFSALAFD
jgi:hypothetical protein